MRKEASVTDFLKRELSGWKKSEAAWLCAATLTILLLSLYWREHAVGIISAVTGVLCVVLTGKGKLSAYLFGTVNTLLYAYLALGARYYGDVMLNLLYYVPMNVVGWVAWKKHMDKATGEVAKKRLGSKALVQITIVTAAAVVVYGQLLARLGGSLPYVDSISTVLSVVAQILCVKRYREQWLLWIVVNMVTIVMWVAAFWSGGESIATLLMWSVFLINAVIMYCKWSKGAEQ